MEGKRYKSVFLVRKESKDRWRRQEDNYGDS